MKKGMLSGIIIATTMFLLTATIIYTYLPTQATVSASETEAIRNYNFTVQIARDYADKAWAEAIYDEIWSNPMPYSVSPSDPTDCNKTISKPSLETRYKNYLDSTNFGNCQTITFDMNVSSIPLNGTYYDQNVAIVLQCSLAKVPSAKTIDYNKTYVIHKKAVLIELVGNCYAGIRDQDKSIVGSAGTEIIDT